MSDPPKRRSTSGLRLGGLNTTTPSVNGIVVTLIVTHLPLTVTQELFMTTTLVFEEEPCHTWLIDAELCRGITADAISALGQLVARVFELGCRTIIVAGPKELPAEGSLNFSSELEQVAKRVGIKPDICLTRKEADELLTNRRWNRLKEAR